MAKLKAPLLSFGASGAIAKAIVYFPWKGLNVAREYVIPANPKTTAQNTQRGYLTDAVQAIHNSQKADTHYLIQADISAYALWASVVQTATTWFNQAVRNAIDQLLAGRTVRIWADGSTTPGAGQLAVTVYEINAVTTAGKFHYGTSKTALIHTKDSTVTTNRQTATIPGLTKGVKYFWQFRPTAPASVVGANSGIYYGTPT